MVLEGRRQRRGGGAVAPIHVSRAIPTWRLRSTCTLVLSLSLSLSLTHTHTLSLSLAVAFSLSLSLTLSWRSSPLAGAQTSARQGRSSGTSSVSFLFTLVAGFRRSLSLKLSETRVCEPQIRARLVSTVHFYEVVVLRLRAVPSTDSPLHSLGRRQWRGRGAAAARPACPEQARPVCFLSLSLSLSLSFSLSLSHTHTHSLSLLTLLSPRSQTVARRGRSNGMCSLSGASSPVPRPR